MKTYAIVFVLAILSSCSDNKVSVFNDWSEQNLRNEPKYILESSSFTPNELLIKDDSIQKWWLESSLKEWFSYEECYYNDDGFVVPMESQNQNNDSVFGKKITKKILRNDTVLITSHFEKMPHSNSEIYILDELGLPYKKTVELWDRPVSIDSFIRDNHNNIIEIYSKGIGIDDYGQSHTQFTLNSLGDPIQEINNQMTIKYNFNDTIYSIDTVHYKYIYDDYSNWIIKAVLNDGIISNIVQRTIEY